MSTRCHIIVKECSTKAEHYVYHHCDGYLKGVGEELKEFIKNIYKPSDLSSDEFCKQIEKWDDSYEYEDCGIHGDEEYIYTVVINSEEKIITVSVEKERYEKDENGDWKTWWDEVESYKEEFKVE